MARLALFEEAERVKEAKLPGWEERVASIAERMEILLGGDGKTASNLLRPITCCGVTVAQRPAAEAHELGFAVWDGACVLAQFLCQDHPELVRDQRVLELGAGTGLVSLALRRNVVCKKVVMTDLEDVLELCRENAERNNILDCEFEVLDWSAPRELPCDVVIGSELISRFYASDALLKTIRALKPKYCILSFQEHDVDSVNAFLKNVAEQNFKLTHLNQKGDKVRIVRLD